MAEVQPLDGDVQVIVNPVAGGHRALAAWRRLEPLARAHCPGLRVEQTIGPAHATTVARAAAASGVRRVVVVGGDGTIQEVVAGLLHTGIALGVVPAGTGNDFSRTHMIPRDHKQALAIAFGSHVRRVDVGLVNDRPYVNVAGVGFDAEVAAWTKYRTRMVSGPALYLAGVLTQLVAYRPQHLTISLDGNERRQQCLLVAVGVGRYYGGGMMICPKARPDDGELDVIIGGNLTKLETLGLLPRVFTGRHLDRPKVEHLRSRHVSIHGGPGLTVHADGEPIGRLPATFGLLAGALLVAVPAGVASGQPGQKLDDGQPGRTLDDDRQWQNPDDGQPGRTPRDGRPGQTLDDGQPGRTPRDGRASDRAAGQASG
jgi:YegS/Rv2252/BmrU family lipid kinase